MTNKLRGIIFLIFYIAFRPKLILLIFKRIHIPSYVQFEWIAKFKLKTIIDVGAYKGDSLMAIKYIKNEITAYAFEPVEENFRILASKFGGGSELNMLALGDKKGINNFYKNKVLQASSLLPISEIGKKRYKFLSKSSIIQTETTTLDDYFKTVKLNKPIFLKLDTQGTEDLVLKGGKRILKDVNFIYIETSFGRLYEGQCSFDDIYNYLRNFGFEYKGGSLIDYGFFPFFNLPRSENSIFMKSSKSKD